MNLILEVKLKPTKEQVELLKATQRRFNEACNFVSKVAFENKELNRYKLHKLTYYLIREKCGHIEKTNRKTQSVFCCHRCGIVENADINAAKNISSLATVNLRIVGSEATKAHFVSNCVAAWGYLQAADFSR